MLPTSYPIQHDRLQSLWEQQIQNGRIQPEDLPEADPGVLESWRRCHPRFDATSKPHPRQLTGDALASRLRTQEALLSIAAPYMEDVYQFMEGADCAIVLLDGATCTLHLVGESSTRDFIESENLALGVYWSENYLGTNGFGVALSTAMPSQVVGMEHYFQSFHCLTTTAAPIHAVNGRIIGLLGVINPVETASAQTISLVMSIARAISNQLQANAYMEEVNRQLSELNTVLDTITDGIIAWKADGTIHQINQQAADLLQIDPAFVRGKSIDQVIPIPSALQQALRDSQTLSDTEIAFHHDHTPIEALVSLRFLRDRDETVGYIMSIRPIAEVRRMVHQQVGSKATLTLDDVFATASSMRPILRQAHIAARGMAPVLLRGEGGVGKNHLARAIHNASGRADGPFLAINCRAIPRELLVSEFLGYEESSERDGRPSKFELANGGTLLFDQIESLSLEMQAALLQVVETNHVMRLGSTRPLPVNVRIIAASSTNLEQAVAEGNFISHLYYRFGVFNLHLPPLRERREDIPMLAERFLSRMTLQRQVMYQLSDEALAVLGLYPWPGNVRELEMVLERAMHQCQNGRIQVIDLPEAIRTGRVMQGKHPQAQPVISAEEAEREAILRAGHACQGHVTEMANRLGISRTTLWRRMKQYKMSSDHFRAQYEQG